MTCSTAERTRLVQCFGSGIWGVFFQASCFPSLPQRSGKQHDNINHTNRLGPRERRRKNRWTSAPVQGVANLKSQVSILIRRPENRFSASARTQTCTLKFLRAITCLAKPCMTSCGGSKRLQHFERFFVEELIGDRSVRKRRFSRTVYHMLCFSTEARYPKYR